MAGEPSNKLIFEDGTYRCTHWPADAIAYWEIRGEKHYWKHELEEDWQPSEKSSESATLIRALHELFEDEILNYSDTSTV